MSDAARQKPEVSIVMPARNDEAAVAQAIRSALGQVGAPPLEVIVAVGESTDATRSVVSDIAHDDHRVRVLSHVAGNTPEGLNAAIHDSHGDVIVRCDAHSNLPSDYVATALGILEETGADVVGGTQRAVGTRFWQRAAAIAMTTPLGVGDAKFHTGGSPGPVDTVYLGVFKRSALERVGLFDESLTRNQDYELNFRIRDSGGVVYYHPALAVDYIPRENPRKLASQYRQYGAWKRVVLRRFPESLRWRQLAAPLLVVGLFVSLVLLLFGQRRLAAVVPGVYLAGVLATTLVELLRRRDLAALGLPVVLPVMHLSWAFGFMTDDIRDPGPRIPRLDT
ncbi:MAG: glycosyltransferase family 2 protein [Acidimicrobiia bacterium]|nr:glycosyltransferase family 2 protein [Acidimicrobiia bacterium]